MTGGISEWLLWVQGAGWLATATIAMRFYIANKKLRIESNSADATARASDRAADLAVETHRDGLTIQLLKAAQSECEALRLELERRGPISEEHVRHFQTALDHIEAMLLAENVGEKKTAERAALAFLNRMRRLADVRGTLMNEAQRISSAVNLLDRKTDGEDG
jgi:succinylglutamate desuccinylase